MVSGRISHETWGDHAALRLASDAVELVVVPAVGGRVISLHDRRRRREWLLQGPPPDAAQVAAWSAEGAIFSGPESFGWDECLPTVSVCDDPVAASSPPLRDHGDQWGRATQVNLEERGTIETTWHQSRWPYRFSRRISIEDARTVLAEYTLASLAEEALPFLWSQHAVLALEPGSCIDLPEADEASCSGSIGIDLPASVGWPNASLGDGSEVNLACVRIGTGWAAKLYAEPPGEIRAVAPNGDRLDFDWDRGFAPSLGVWLAYGGWPADGPPVEQVALEPTTSGHDALEGAMADGVERRLGPGERVEWWVRLRLSG